MTIRFEIHLSIRTDSGYRKEMIIRIFGVFYVVFKHAYIVINQLINLLFS